jgi:hypothetical protein
MIFTADGPTAILALAAELREADVAGNRGW